MQLARVAGTVVASRKETRLEGLKFLLLEQLGTDNKPTGGYVVAADAVGAGLDEVVMYASGSSARQRRSPSRARRGSRRWASETDVTMEHALAVCIHSQHGPGGGMSPRATSPVRLDVAILGGGLAGQLLAPAVQHRRHRPASA